MLKGTPQRTLRERFEASVQRRPDGHWIWTGAIFKATGYGQISVKRDGKWTPTTAHRVAYELLVGPIPEGLTLDHIKERCGQRACVKVLADQHSPPHLEPVTQRENTLRGDHPSAIAVRTGICKYGHAYTPENTIHRANGSRECRACIKRRNDLRPRKGGRRRG